MMSPSVVINKYRDFKYSGKDADSFLRCCACRCYTPFLFYIVSKVALEAAHMDPKHNFFCVECVPRPASVETGVMYPDDSLIKNEEFLRLFAGFRYYNPYYRKYASQNRIIITEKCKIHPSFKKVARKAMPPEVKLGKIYELFMPVHQMACKKYAGTLEMYTDIRQKYREIITAYCETNTSRELYDDIDVMIERTPFQSHHRSRTSVTDAVSTFPSDSLHMRSGSSEEESQTYTSLSLGISSESRGGNTQLPESQRSVALSEQQESQSSVVSVIHVNILDISSQDANANESAEVIASLTPNSSIDSSSSSILVPRNRPLQISVQHTGDSQEAGPSGLQRKTRKRDEQQSVISPKPKRPRRKTTKPMNPSPAEVQSSRVQYARMPRLNGG